MSNRDRLNISLDGPWRLFQHAPLAGWEMLGTVQRGYEIGALARNKVTGNLVMVRAGAVSMLDQRKAQVALTSAKQAEGSNQGQERAAL